MKAREEESMSMRERESKNSSITCMLSMLKKAVP